MDTERAKPSRISPAAMLLAAVVAMLAPAASADVKLAAPFTDHMVLQRGILAPVWGTADAGEDVTVEFAGQTRSAKADDAGKWSVKLEPMEASAESRAVTVRGKNALTLQDVLVGEVWLCAGQ